MAVTTVSAASCWNHSTDEDRDHSKFTVRWTEPSYNAAGSHSISHTLRGLCPITSTALLTTTSDCPNILDAALSTSGPFTASQTIVRSSHTICDESGRRWTATCTTTPSSISLFRNYGYTANSKIPSGSQAIRHQFWAGNTMHKDRGRYRFWS